MLRNVLYLLVMVHTTSTCCCILIVTICLSELKFEMIDFLYVSTDIKLFTRLYTLAHIILNGMNFTCHIYTPSLVQDVLLDKDITSWFANFFLRGKDYYKVANLLQTSHLLYIRIQTYIVYNLNLFIF